MFYAGLDIGTSGCKASVMDGGGTVLRRAYKVYSTTSPKPGYIELDARAVCEAAKEALAEIAGPDVGAISIASFGEPHVLPGKFVTLAFNASAGAAMKWYMNTFETERFAKEIESGENVYAILDGEVGDSPTNILFLPYVSGSGTPWFDSKTGGAFIGLMQSTKRPEIYKSILEGITYEIKYNETLLEKCGLTFHSITSAGGAAVSAPLMQIKADIMERRIDVLGNKDAGTAGLALICAKAMGEIDDIEAAAKNNVKISASYEPDEDRAIHYAQKLKEYRSIYTSIKSLSSMPSSDYGMKKRRR